MQEQEAAQGRPRSHTKQTKMTATVPGTRLTTEEVRKFQRVDKSLGKQIAMAVPDAQTSSCQHGSYFTYDGLLYRQFSPKQHVAFSQLVVPSGLRSEILCFAHDNSPIGSMGIRKAVKQLMRCFYWPGMKNDLRRYRQNSKH